MAYARYAHARSFCAGKSVLEVACGAGQGLGFLAARASRVVGGDYSQRLIDVAVAHYGHRVPLVCLDAHTLPFAPASFDVILLFEAIYYLADARRFIREVRRTLRADGVLLICTVNRDWRDFNPSPFSTSYPSAAELNHLLTSEGFSAALFGAFRDRQDGLRASAISAVRQAAVALGLIPRTMKGKERLKRLFYGPLAEAPPEIADRDLPAVSLEPLTPATPAGLYKVLYAVARRRQTVLENSELPISAIQ